MALTSAMLTGFTGITANGVAVDTVGNNLANLNTTAFKSQRTLFESLLYKTISEGEAPDGEHGGTLPRQIGLGTTVAAIQRNFQQGGFESTGFPSDLAIDGEGFFIVDPGTGGVAYTRDGAFRLDSAQTLVSTSGAALQVFQADDTGQITDTLGALRIPLGAASQAIPTTQVEMDGRLHSGTSIASAGAIVSSQALRAAGGNPASASTNLTALADDNGVPLFSDGDVVTVQGSKGGITMPARNFVVGDTGSTLGDFAVFLESALGLTADTSGESNEGVVIGDGTEFAEGALVIRSRPGEIHAISLDGGSIVNTTGGVPSAFSFTTEQNAVGDGVTTTFQVFDSLGNPLDVRLRFSLDAKSNGGTVWSFVAESSGDSDASPVLGTGTVTFDAEGQFVGSTGTDLTIDREGSGATTPLSFSLDLAALTGLASRDGTSEVIMSSQDGAPAGIATGFSIDADGIVRLSYSNQLTDIIGQVALASFTNSEGLVALGENQFVEGPDSGDALIEMPRTGRAGTVRAGALEQSNVEIAREFINLISASTGISSASRVVRTADELLQELLLLAR